METETGLTVIESSAIELVREPTEVLGSARKAAKALTTVIDQKPRKVTIKGQTYLEYEDWQTVGQFYGYTTKTHGAVPVEINGIKGAKAQADLIDFRSGLIVGGAEAYCLADEENWQHKPWFQLASMAQTRAGSKALRNRLAWVVVLAGYAGTPAEEMIQEKVSEKKEREEHYCQEHGIAFFKKGNMKGYAHKLDDGSWCNEHTEKEGQPSTNPPSQPTKPTAEASSDDLSGIVFGNAGGLKNYMKNERGMSTEQINAATKAHDLTTPEGLADCWSCYLAISKQQ